MRDPDQPMTELEERRQRRSLSLVSQAPTDLAAHNLVPAVAEDFQRELTSCLALCAPAGMGDLDRAEWLRVAWATLNGIPADLLSRGAAVARKQCDHPSKIVPAIMRTISQSWDWRKESFRDAIPRERQIAPSYCPPDVAAKILTEAGLKRSPNAANSNAPVDDLPPIKIPRAEPLPADLPDAEVPSIAGLTVREIFEQRNKLRAARMMETDRGETS